jgi:flavin-dependent dehydrogenase
MEMGFPVGYCIPKLNNVIVNTVCSKYDIAIIGGGLAGLALSIQAARAGYKTILFEKEKYPFHKVCGEYISFEAWDFLEELGMPLSQMNLPIIRKLLLSAPNGKVFKQELPLGGFGISRYKLDAALATIAKSNGVEIREETKVTGVNFENDFFTLQPSFNIQCRVTAGAYGKRSNLDVKWKRKFAEQKPNKLNNYIGVKYHVQYDFPENSIALHNFSHGYCGISRVEDDKCCLCYLSAAKNLNESGNSIEAMEKNILSRNPFLKKIFKEAGQLTPFPVIISQLSFEKKTQVENHVLLIGDAAGMITPLCGNGMSMALHSSKIAFELINLFLKNEISREQLETGYQRRWHSHFHSRLQTGRIIQRFFGSPLLTNLLISAMKPFPRLADRLVSATHGQPF